MDALRSIQPSAVFTVANTLAGGLLLGGGIAHLIYHSFSSIIIGIYAVVFGIFVLLLEWWPVAPQQHSTLYRHASFFYSFFGRGIFYGLFGVLLLDHYVVAYVFGGILLFEGVIFLILQFLNIYEVPSSMRPPTTDPEAQPVWNADVESA